MRKFILPLFLTLIISLATGWLGLIYQDSGVPEVSLEGVDLLVPGDNKLVPLMLQDGAYFGGTFTDDQGVYRGFVVLDQADIEKISETEYIAPFAVDREGDGLSVYTGFFNRASDGTMSHQGSLLLGKHVLLKDVEVKNTRSLVVRFLTRHAEQTVLDDPNTAAAIFGVMTNGNLEEAYRIVNGDIGDAYFDEPIPRETLSAGIYKVTGAARGFWFFEASMPLELQDLEGNILASAIATADGEWMTEDLVPFTADIAVPEAVGGGVLVLKRDNSSGLAEHDASLSMSVFFE